MNDPVKTPDHYTKGGIETIDFIRAKLTPAEFQGHCIANVIKYSTRWRAKGGVEDLRKAQTYLAWAIESVEAESTAGVGALAVRVKITMPKPEQACGDEFAEFRKTMREGMGNIARKLAAQAQVDIIK